jgi:hypothetical protein
VRYENLLTRSFAILRRKLWLWPLALLAGETSSGGGGGGNVSFQSRGPTSGGPPDLSWVPQWYADRASLFAEIAVAFLVVLVVWFLVSCIASGALLSAAARVDAGEQVTFGDAWQTGLRAFRRVLAFKLLLAAGFLVPILLLALPPLVGLFGGSRGLLLGLLLDLPLLIAYFYWSAFLGWFAELAVRACVLDELGAWNAFAAAWALLKRRFPRIALTTVVFIGVGIGIGLVTSILFAFVEAPVVGAVAGAAYEGRWSEIPATIGFWLAILVPVSLAVSSAVGAYFATGWTLAYRRFDVEGELPDPPLLAA